jgi:molybdopterin synthase sulfur carrier subunit
MPPTNYTNRTEEHLGCHRAHPPTLRNLTGEKSTVQTDGSNLGDCIAHLESSYPGIRDRLMDETGQLRRFVNVYINGEDVRFVDGLGTGLKDGDEVSIVPAVAGGA